MATPSSKIGLLTATSLVVASMIGTGVFTSLGFQVVDIRSVFALLMLWVVGGIVALCGALTYGELGTVLPRSGGEYNILSKVYHPGLGFVAGRVSATVGFSAPISLASMALATYLKTVFPNLPANHFAAATVLFFSLLHGYSIRWGSLFQDWFTILKVLLILIFIGASFWVEAPQPISILPRLSDFELLGSPAFAVSLVYVSYAYTGWNTSIYIVGEIQEPEKNLFHSLFFGTLIVFALYLGLNYVFLYTVPMDMLSGQIEVGFLSGTAIFGIAGGKIMAVLISLLPVSTVSAFTFAGPRITQAMGEDFPALKVLAVKDRKGIPLNSFVFQFFVALLFIYSSTFEQVLVYAAFSLIFITSIAVSSIYWLRKTQPLLERPYRTWGYPWTPMIFLIVNTWTMAFLLIDKTLESIIGLAIPLIGFIIYIITYKRN